MPFGESAAWMRNAMGMALLANINRDSKKQRQPFKPDDFMPGTKKDEAPMAQGISEAFMALAKTQKAKPKEAQKKDAGNKNPS